MKVMTLNTHSWLETSPYEKLQRIADKIAQEDYDIVALQEVNQSLTSKNIANYELQNFCSVQDQTPIREDNFAYCLIQLLEKQGKTYYWSWEMSHIGYDIYEEGNALLSKSPLVSQAFCVSETNKKEDYHTRNILIGQTCVDEQEIIVASCHFSWWIDEKSGFVFEWQRLEEHLSNVSNPIFLLGDFNNPADEIGYQLVAQSSLEIIDSYKLAQKKSGEGTIKKKIDGWENNTEELRIDYIYLPKESRVKEYRHIFDGKTEALVSDHYGIEIITNEKEK